MSVLIDVPVGPQHPALKEPLHFLFQVDGEYVVDVRPRLGYNHRGIEKLAESKTYLQNALLTARICGICQYAHSTCYTQTAEKLLGVEAPPRAQYLRLVLAELERIHSHLLWLGVMAHEIGFDTMFMYCWRDRETVLDLFELTTGNRVQHAMNTIGGVRRDFTPSMVETVKKAITKLRKRLKYYEQLVQKERTIRVRTENIGFLSPRDVVDLCAVGPVARASGVKRDVRLDDPYLVYDEVDFHIVVDDGCDVLARTLVRCREMVESADMILNALERLPDGPVRVKAPTRAGKEEVIGRVEAPRGELFYYIRGNGTNKPERLKVRTPTIANILSLCKMLKGCYIADIPPIIACIDPCIACMERLTFIDPKGRRWSLSHEELRRYGLKWYGLK